MQRKWTLILLIGVAALGASAHWLLPGGVHCLMANHDVRVLSDWQCPGVGMVLIEDGEVEIEGYGFASLAAREPVEADTKFNIASLSKQFTGLAVAMLIERGLVRLHSPAASYVGELTKPDVTVAHLLYHTSGLPDYLAECMTQAVVTNADVLAFANESPLESRPGEAFEYSNTGYVLLAILVERVTGEAFSDWMRANVFRPLGMRDTELYRPGFTEVVEAYLRPWANPPSCDGVQGDGVVVTTPRDFSKWLREMARPTLVTLATRDLMWTSGQLEDGQSVDYGFGWAVSDEEIYHEGSWAGYEALVVYDKLSGDWHAAFTNYLLYNLSEITDFYLLHSEPP